MIVPALFLLTTSISLWPKALSHTVSFGSDQPIVGTYFFYWYDIHTKGHFLNHDGTDALVDHPTNPNDYSYNSVNWWKRELHDVISAKVDFILLVYWGIPNRQNDPKFHDAWSFSGLPKLVEAWDQIAGQGNPPPPRIGMFYDTSTLELNPDRFHVDLTTSEGKQWFYETIRDFFSLVPPRTWAMIDQKPIIFLYSASFAKKQDPEIFDYVRRNFKTDFTCEPFIVKEISWHGDADATYAWGGAVSPRWNDVTALRPGYDHHAVPGREPLVVDRENGDFYKRVWRSLLAQHPTRRSRIVTIETWNELHEGTDICDTIEYGGEYIDLTAKFADQFRSGDQIPIDGKFSSAESVSWSEGLSSGINITEVDDGLFETVEVNGVSAIKSKKNKTGGRYVYFRIDDSFLFDQEIPVTIELAYLDDGCTQIELNYDSSDTNGSVRDGAFKFGGQQKIDDSREWKTTEFSVKDGRFVNRCNGADFRFAVTAGNLTVKQVKVAK